MMGTLLRRPRSCSCKWFATRVARVRAGAVARKIAVFTLIAMAVSLYGLVVLLESRLLSWRQRPDQPTIIS